MKALKKMNPAELHSAASGAVEAGYARSLYDQPTTGAGGMSDKRSARDRDEYILTQAMDTIIDRYVEICLRSRPRLTDREWLAVYDCCNGPFFAPASTLVGAVLANVERSPELGDKYDIDQPTLQRKIASLSYCEEVALVDAIERFWAQKRRMK